MQILGDQNAVLKDQTRLFEAEYAEPYDPLYPIICSDIKSADEAYIRIPIKTKTKFPTVWKGERQPESVSVPFQLAYDKGTFTTTMEWDQDLMSESKSYTLDEETSEAAITCKVFPSFNLTNNVILENPNAYDGVAFYSATGHYYAGQKRTDNKNLINNVVTQTGTTVSQLQTDLQTGMTRLRTFVDYNLKSLNPLLRYGDTQVVIHCPAALEIPFRQVLFNSLNPIPAPVTNSGTAAVSGSGMRDLGLGGVARLFVDPYLDLTSASTWYLHYVGMKQRPFVYAESYGMRAKALSFGTEYQVTKRKVGIFTEQRFLQGVYHFHRSICVGTPG